MSRTRIVSEGIGVLASSFLRIVLMNLCALAPVWMAMWSLRISSNKLWPSKLFAPVTKILLRLGSFGERAIEGN